MTYHRTSVNTLVNSAYMRNSSKVETDAWWFILIFRLFSGVIQTNKILLEVIHTVSVSWELRRQNMLHTFPEILYDFFLSILVFIVTLMSYLQKSLQSTCQNNKLGDAMCIWSEELCCLIVTTLCKEPPPSKVGPKLRFLQFPKITLQG